MKSVWQESVQLPEFEPLNGDRQTDVLIIGGGIAGILTAYFLKQNGIDYILAEKDRICAETTQNTTAKITFQHGLIYDKITKSRGIECAEKYLKANKTAFEKYCELCKDIDCDFEIKDNYVYSLKDRRKLESEMEALQKIGYNAELCDSLSLPIKTAGAVKFKNQAQFNPLKFINSVCAQLNIYENTLVEDIKEKTAVTKYGSIKAERIIVTTHFPFINRHGLYPLKLYQHRSYVTALENAAQVNGMYVDESDSGLSFRNYGKLLLLGGGGHRTGQQSECFAELRSFAAESYPNATEKYSWAAQDCMSLDSIPYIGQYSAFTPDLFVASGFNKWGMTGSMLSALLINDLLLKNQNDYAEVFSPSRSILHPQLFVNAFESAKNLLSISDKRCSHLGCALKYNSCEHTWDCPCHGSRFSEQGEVINNPANKGIVI